jgi:hypothetical protein
LHFTDANLGLALREEHSLKAFGKRVLRIYVPNEEETTEGWRSWLSEEHHKLFCSPNII